MAKATEMEENPGTARKAGGATDVSTTLPGTAREEMTPDKADVSALVTQWQLGGELNQGKRWSRTSPLRAPW